MGHWHDLIGHPTLTDAAPGRLVQNAIVSSCSDNLRRKRVLMAA